MNPSVVIPFPADEPVVIPFPADEPVRGHLFPSRCLYVYTTSPPLPCYALQVPSNVLLELPLTDLIVSGVARRADVIMQSRLTCATMITVRAMMPHSEQYNLVSNLEVA